MRSMANEKEDALGPLRRAMGKVSNLNEAVARIEDAPEGLRVLGRRWSEARNELMSLGRVLMMSQDPSLAAEAHELAQEAEDAVWTGQQKVKATLRRLRTASDLSETGSMDLPLPWVGC
jgi:hypothetical protein